MSLTFKSILSSYENSLAYIDRQVAHDKGSSEYWKGYFRGVYHSYRELKLYVNDFPRIIQATAEDKKKFADVDDNLTLFGTFNYRNNIYPVYNDDYGQCLSIKIGDEFYGGGTYNCFPEEDFSSIIDTVIDEKYR